MCGIVGIIGTKNVADSLIEGLKRLEYRGYDSAGIATLQNGQIVRLRAEGKLLKLTEKQQKTPLPGTIGIGHTRWATHGAPNETNAHPHATDKVAIVHNGIIENFLDIKDDLSKKGHHFESQTDSEVIAHLITHFLNQGKTPKQAVFSALKKLHGAFALAILFTGENDLLIAARRGSPLAIGYGKGEMYLGSDAIALAPLTQKICYLEEGDVAILTRTSAEIYDEDETLQNRPITISALTGAVIGKDNYKHFMQKEIFEQPTVIGETLNHMIDPVEKVIKIPELKIDLSQIHRISITACGTSSYAGMVGKYWLEQAGKIPVSIELASEFRYRTPTLDSKTLVLCISQSGETADTLAALRYAKSCGAKVLSIVNVPTSTMARESDQFIQTLAGPEIGVASTKAFSTQLTVLAGLSLQLADARGSNKSLHLNHLMEIPQKAADILRLDPILNEIGRAVSEYRYVLYLGRGTLFPIALEGALKLKEISYIHAEGYAAGELKHGPIALIEDDVPIIVLNPMNELYEKTASNIQEVQARGGKVIHITDKKGAESFKNPCWHTLILPESNVFESPILYSLPVQLLAYHAAVAKGTDVDQPRNLAKSVTVE